MPPQGIPRNKQYFWGKDSGASSSGPKLILRGQAWVPTFMFPYKQIVHVFNIISLILVRNIVICWWESHDKLASNPGRVVLILGMSNKD